MRKKEKDDSITEMRGQTPSRRASALAAGPAVLIGLLCKHRPQLESDTKAKLLACLSLK